MIMRFVCHINSVKDLQPMKKERITCPLCKKRILDIRLNGDASVDTKCIHCGHIINVQWAEI